jgi:hypothetical protein
MPAPRNTQPAPRFSFSLAETPSGMIIIPIRQYAETGYNACRTQVNKSCVKFSKAFNYINQFLCPSEFWIRIIIL